MNKLMHFLTPKNINVDPTQTKVKTEVLAGVTAFFASIFCIIAVPGMISGGETNVANAVFVAAVIGSVIGCLFMAFIAKMPLVVYPAIGTTSYFAFTALPMIVLLSGDESLERVVQYQIGMFLLLISGIVFTLLSVTGLTEKILNGIPKNIKIATVPAIGLFITLLGLRLSGLVVNSPATFVTFVNLRNFSDPEAQPAIIGAMVAFVGLLLLAVLHHKKIKASFVIAIIATTILAYVTGAATIPDYHTFSLTQQFSDWANYGFLQMDMTTIWTFGSFGAVIGVILSIVLALVLTNALDAIATTFGILKSGGMVDSDECEDAKKYVGKGVLSDALSSVIAASLGGAPNTTVVSGSSAVIAGGRTGLTSLVVAVLTAALLLAGPFVTLIPNVAIAPTLIFIGALMLSGLKNLDFSDITDYFPAFVALIFIVFTFNIGTGICLALITHIILKLVTGQVRDISLVSIIISILFTLQFIF